MQHGNLMSLQTDFCYGLRQSRGTRPQTKTQGSQVHDQVTRFKISVPQIINEPLFEREYETKSSEGIVLPKFLSSLFFGPTLSLLNKISSILQTFH
jgi:hypothetical protein